GTDTTELVDLDDVDVIEDRRELGFAHERLDEARVLREMRKQPLECDRAFEAIGALLERAMHSCHATDAEALVHEVRPELLFYRRVNRHLSRVVKSRMNHGGDAQGKAPEVTEC